MSTQNTAIVISNPEEARAAFSVANLIMHPFAMERVEKYASKLAASKNLLPACFHNDQSACEALVIQSASMGMDPAGIGRHAFKAPNGTINFEAKVFQAIATIGAGIQFDESYSEGWERVIGKGVEKTSQQNKKYQAQGWAPKDEEGLYLDLTGTWPDGRAKTLRVYMAECKPRLSTNWVNDPRMQTYYNAIKKFLRRYSPGIILGVFDRDDSARGGELEKPAVKDITPAKSHDTSIDSLMGAGTAIVQPDIDVIEEGEIVEPEPESIDDLMGGGAAVVNDDDIALFDQFYDRLNNVKTTTDYKEVYRDIKEAFERNALAEDEYKTLIDCVATIREGLEEELRTKKINQG